MAKKKLTEEQKARLVADREKGLTYAQLSAKYLVSNPVINRALREAGKVRNSKRTPEAQSHPPVRPLPEAPPLTPGQVANIFKAATDMGLEIVTEEWWDE